MAGALFAYGRQARRSSRPSKISSPASAGDALAVIEGGNLTPHSGLRTLAENERCLAALPCYMDNGVRATIAGRECRQNARFGCRARCARLIVERLGGDRGQSRSEVEKLPALASEGDGARTVSLDDALAVLGDTAAMSASTTISSSPRPSMAKSPRWIAPSTECSEGGNPVQFRAYSCNATSISSIWWPRTRRRGRRSGSGRCGARGPAAFWPDARTLQATPSYVAPAAPRRTLRAILRAELDCKTTGNPHEAIARRLCLALASSA